MDASLSSNMIDEIANLKGEKLRDFLSGEITGEQFKILFFKNKSFREMMSRAPSNNYPWLSKSKLIGKPVNDSNKDVLKNNLYSFNDNPLP